MAKVSVIIPVYNVEKYLRDCLDSVVNQTLKDIEIICVNDGSPDNCGAILDEYVLKDNRIKAIHQENKGVAVARNKALEVASGEYIGFLDSDDIIDNDFYEKLYNLAINDNLDIVKAGVLYVDYKKQTHITELNKLIEHNGKYSFTSEWWSALYRADLINDNKIRFPDECCIGEDCVFLIKLLLKCKSFGLCNNTFYHYIRREDSLATIFLNSKKILSAINSKKHIVDELNSASIKQEEYDKLYYEHYKRLFNTIFRIDNEESKRLLIDQIINLYHKCKNISYIENKKNSDLYKFLSKCKREKDIIYPPCSFKEKLFSIININNGKKLITILGIKIKI